MFKCTLPPSGMVHWWIVSYLAQQSSPKLPAQSLQLPFWTLSCSYPCRCQTCGHPPQIGRCRFVHGQDHCTPSLQIQPDDDKPEALDSHARGTTKSYVDWPLMQKWWMLISINWISSSKEMNPITRKSISKLVTAKFQKSGPNTCGTAGISKIPKIRENCMAVRFVLPQEPQSCHRQWLPISQ